MRCGLTHRYLSRHNYIVGSQIIGCANLAGRQCWPVQALVTPETDYEVIGQGGHDIMANDNMNLAWRAADGIIAIDRYVHDMPASVDTVIENFSDQSHVPWAHHGVAGDRCALPGLTAKGVATRIVGKRVTEAGTYLKMSGCRCMLELRCVERTSAAQVDV